MQVKIRSIEQEEVSFHVGTHVGTDEILFNIGKYKVKFRAKIGGVLMEGSLMKEEEDMKNTTIKQLEEEIAERIKANCEEVDD